MHNRILSSIVAAAAVAAVAAAPASAQTPGSMSRDLQSALDAAQAAAIRPGDEALGCDALERELVAAAKHPALQAYIAKSGVAAQQQIDAMNAMASGRTATQAAMTVFSAVVPGGAWLGHNAAVAQAESQRAQAETHVQRRMQQAQEMVGILPQLLRGQRVLELAQTRDCGWLRDAGQR